MGARWLLGLGCLVVVGCGEVQPLAPDAAGTDTADAAPLPSCFGRPFGAPEPVAGVNTAAREESMRLTGDELTAYFTRAGVAMVATRADVAQPFGAPVALAIPGSTSPVASLAITGDGLALYFVSSENGTLGGPDIYRVTRATAAAAFGDFAHLVAASSSSEESDVSVTPDGAALYVSSSRNGGRSGILRADLRTTPMPAPVIALSAPGQFSRAVISADQRTLLYQTDNNIYETARASTTTPFAAGAPHTELDAKDPAIQDHPTWLSADGCRLYLHSDRAGGAGLLDVYVAVRSPG